MEHMCTPDEWEMEEDEVPDWESMSLEEIEEWEYLNGTEMYFEDEADYVNHMIETHGYIPTGSFDGYYD